MTALHLLLAAAPVTCGMHEDGKTHARTWEVTDWSKAPRVFTATSAVAVYERPHAESRVVGPRRRSA